MRFDRDQNPGTALVCTGLMRVRIVRRSVGVVLVVAGALLMWLSPETLAGAAIAGAGIALELIGIALERT